MSSRTCEAENSTWHRAVLLLSLSQNRFPNEGTHKATLYSAKSKISLFLVSPLEKDTESLRGKLTQVHRAEWRCSRAWNRGPCRRPDLWPRHPAPARYPGLCLQPSSEPCSEIVSLLHFHSRDKLRASTLAACVLCSLTGSTLCYRNELVSGVRAQIGRVFGEAENIPGPLLSHHMAFYLLSFSFPRTLPYRSLG